MSFVQTDASIVTALYETPASYRSEDGVTLCAAELWQILKEHNALSNSAFFNRITKALEKSVLVCNIPFS